LTVSGGPQGVSGVHFPGRSLDLDGCDIAGFARGRDPEQDQLTLI